MSACKIPQGYDPKYGIMDTERAIKRIKDFFETELSKALNLSRISAPCLSRIPQDLTITSMG